MADDYTNTEENTSDEYQSDEGIKGGYQRNKDMNDDTNTTTEEFNIDSDLSDK